MSISIFDAAVQLIASPGPPPVPPLSGPRIEHALKMIDELPFDEVTLTALARRLCLSPSRLRHLFKEVTGNTVSHYARWAAVWRVVSLWSQGRRLTEIAQEVGFHDLAHLDHALWLMVRAWRPEGAPVLAKSACWECSASIPDAADGFLCPQCERPVHNRCRRSHERNGAH